MDFNKITVFVCSGCGTSTHDPAKYAEYIKLKGALSCCPEHKYIECSVAPKSQRPPDYFTNLVNQAKEEAYKAMQKFPQPNYTLLKFAEEAGEVIKAAVHYGEQRGSWEEVEGEMVQALAMLIRFVTEGDHKNGIHPPISITMIDNHGLTKDMINLIFAARDLVYSDQVAQSEERDALDKAVEAFAGRLPWVDQPEELE